MLESVYVNYDSGFWRRPLDLDAEFVQMTIMAPGRTALFFGLVDSTFKVDRRVKSWLAEEDAGYRTIAKKVVEDALRRHAETGETTTTRKLLDEAMKICGGSMHPKLMHDYIVSEVP